MLTRRRLLLFLFVLLALAGAAAWYLWPRSITPPEWANDYDVAAKPPETIAPGTVVGTTPPDGWTHLVIKSLPRVRPGEEKNIPALARSQTVRMSRWMFTVFAADVWAEIRGNETRHQLRAIGLGLGTSIGGVDVVITPETAKGYGVELDWITRTILTKGYETQALAVVVVHGPTFAILDTPVYFRCGSKNRLVRFRYALMVDPATGRLDVLLWLLDAGGCSDPAAAVILNPSQIEEAELIPDPDGFDVIGVASETAFGIDRLPAPPGTRSLPDGVRELANSTKFTPADARSLEAALRQLVAP